MARYIIKAKKSVGYYQLARYLIENYESLGYATIHLKHGGGLYPPQVGYGSTYYHGLVIMKS